MATTVKTKAIIPAKTAILTFRDSGYRNTASALAELIDNAIEAQATTIQVLTFEEQVLVQNRRVFQIKKVAVYDDGSGMGADTLAICLQFGNGTRLDSRKGIGRFGIGLPNSSVSQCRRVDIYSWQSKAKCYHTYLDVDEVREGSQESVNVVVEKEIPKEFLDAIEGKLSRSGTLVVWSKCDRLDLTRSRTLYKRLNADLCRIYRHFLDDDDDYGKRINVQLITTGKDRKILELRANDPIYLMTPNNTPGKEDEATNVLFDKVTVIPVEYEKGKRSNVEIRFSMALPETQALGGGSPLGKHYRSNTGISFVRAGREIDFGAFGYFDDREYRHRWWGCEVRFEPVLDELFGVTNNKQSVRSMNYLDLGEFKKDHPEDWKEILENNKKMWLRAELSRRVGKSISTMMGTITHRHSGKRGGNAKERATADKSTKVANQELKTLKVETRSVKEGGKKTVDEKQQEWAKALLEADAALKPEDASDVALGKITLVMEKEFGSWPGSQFFTVETVGSTCVLKLNKQHPFFLEVYEPLQQKDDRWIDAIDLTLMSYARTEDELYFRVDDLDEIRDHWGRHLKNFLQALKREA